jgi:UDP-N-acetylglucosamine 2-epimerase (non-hydrolysing)
MMKVMTIVGTRPELIKMCRVIAAFDEHTEHILVHTGQNYDYELNGVFFEDLGIRRPDLFLNAAGDGPIDTIAKVMVQADAALAKHKPDALLLYGDTNSCMAVLPAKRRKIPVFHMEAGNRCFDQRVPEELNRKVVDHLSDINLTLTDHARRYLIAEGLPPDRVIKVGSHMHEVLGHFMPKIRGSQILAQLGLTEGQYFLVSLHREENVDTPARLSDAMDTIAGLAEAYGFDIVVSTHPRTRQRLESAGLCGNHPKVRFLKPFGFTDYVRLQLGAACTLSDSGTITEESSLLGTPAITLRETHERPEGMDEGVLIMAGLRRSRVLDAVRVVMSQHKHTQTAPPVTDYQAGRVSKKVIRIVLSYTDYVRRTVWELEPL